MLKDAAEYIQASNRMVILTGAGCSVDSGVPIFDLPPDGGRRSIPIRLPLLKPLKRNLSYSYAFYSARVKHLKEIQPHDGHNVLWKWEQQGRIGLIATQNVDGLHQSAGNRRVHELHGSIRRFRCNRCGQEAAEDDFMENKLCDCGGRLRPDIVLFGENLPKYAWDESLRAIVGADVYW